MARIGKGASRPWSRLARNLPFATFALAAAALVAVAASSDHATVAAPKLAAATASDPSTAGQWGPLMSWPLVAVHSSLLDNGNVVVWDAWETGGTPSVRVWNPTTGAFTAAPNLTTQIFCSAQLQLPDGRVLVVGGHNGGEFGINATQVFDPTTNGWSAGANMTTARWYPTATMLGDGRVVAISGQIQPGVYADTPEIYSPTTNTWTKMTSVNTSFVHDDGYPMTYLLPNGKLAVFDPEGGHTRLLDPNAQTLTVLPDNPVLFGSFAMYRPGKFISAGGGAAWGSPTGGSTATIDMNASTPAWTTTAPMSYGRYQHNLVVLADGTVMAIGGSQTVDQTDLNGSLPSEIWNPDTQTWTTVAALQNPRMYHSTALLLPDGRVLAAGGGRWSTAHDYSTAEIYSPPYLFNGARPTITSAPASAGYASTMTVQTPDAASIKSVALVDLATNTHTLDGSQRYVPLNFTAGGGSLSVQAPLGANIAPPGYYMLFVVNASGVPSVASTVRIVNIADTTPPSIAVTAPAAGASVSGTVGVSATASDNVGVAGVQLLVDGVPLGAAITYPPYSASWDTTLVPNGAHTVAAKAWDAAGNTTTSASVSVTVANPNVPPVISGVAAQSVTGTSAVISWATDHASDSQVDYGTTASYGTSTTLSTTLTTSHSQPLSGLTPKTTYHFRVKSRDVNGNLSVSGDNTFMTAPPPPAFRSRSNITNGTTVSTPAGVVAGDLLLASLELDGSLVTVTAPAGWTRALDTTAAAGTSSVFHAQVWYKVAAAGEPSSYTFNVTGSSWTDIGVLDYANVDPGTPIDVAAGVDSGSTNTPSTPSVTTTLPGDLLAALFVNFGGGTWSAGSGMTARNNFDGNLSEDALQNVPGASGAKTATDDTVGQMSAQIVALRPLQSDTTPPSVTVTAPASGATVSGTGVTLSASASDDVGVAWVQLQVDGASVGSRVTSPPYQVSWDSTQVANGSHVVSAQASDLAGNLATSSGVSVTVSNAPPPAISGVSASGITTSGATVSWTTDVGSSSQVEYGTTTSYGTSSALDTTSVTTHAVGLSGLAAGTLYHYRVKSGAPGGSLAVSGDFTFTTALPAPPAISGVAASGISASGATVTWTTDTASDTTVQYGLTTSYGSSAGSAGLVTSHSQALSGLSASTVYHYRVQSKDGFGQVSVSGDFTFTTTNAPPVVPAFRSASSVIDGTTVSKPSGVLSGDLLLATLEVDADPATVTGPAGWTKVLDTLGAGGTGSAFHTQVWWKLAGSSEPASYTWTVGGGPWVDIGLLAYSGVSQTAPIDVASGRDAGSTATPTTPSVTTAGANEMVVALFVNFDSGSWTAGSGMTRRYNFDSNTAQDVLQAAAGSTGAKTATDTDSGPTTAQIVAIKGP